ncbi:hypothetical protein [Microlunatus flavus]|uniref:Uncharacterized protein n=1 Tax=Microlunatus flavus TaxID=1036181 RepID=A0A1H9IWQ6_9ACTN|nr:hypothetical protein [Microlunatus flavus]SEQ79043.1 hypothetical protein SAMN05421756_10611 [Microlunatus flavus]
MEPRHPPSARWLDGALAVTLTVGLLFNLARAVAGDGGWPSQQPWRGVRLVVGVLFLLALVARLTLWAGARLRARRARRP